LNPTAAWSRLQSGFEDVCGLSEELGQQWCVLGKGGGMPDVEGPLVGAAMRYLKEHYGEDTVSMTVTQNGVEGGNGVLGVDCTVSIGGVTSDWSKRFTFRSGRISTMSARMR